MFGYKKEAGAEVLVSLNSIKRTFFYELAFDRLRLTLAPYFKPASKKRNSTNKNRPHVTQSLFQKFKWEKMAVQSFKIERDSTASIAQSSQRASE